MISPEVPVRIHLSQNAVLCMYIYCQICYLSHWTTSLRIMVNWIFHYILRSSVFHIARGGHLRWANNSAGRSIKRTSQPRDMTREVWRGCRKRELWGIGTRRTYRKGAGFGDSLPVGCARRNSIPTACALLDKLYNLRSNHLENVQPRDLLAGWAKMNTTQAGMSGWFAGMVPV